MNSNKNCTVAKDKFSPELYCPDKFLIFHKYYIRRKSNKYYVKD